MTPSRTIRRLFLVVLLVSLFAAACRPAPSNSCDSCAQARLRNQWCGKCDIGYVAGAPMKSKLLFECMDAHGHELQNDAIQCSECQAAMKVDGFCNHCKTGWVDGMAYFSRLTYTLGRGQPRPASTINCQVCKENSKRYGWCDACNVGMLGNTAVTDRALFDEGARRYDILLIAIDASARCDGCAMAIVTDTPCHLCQLTYRDGKSRPGIHY